jgi:hypothetical protein
MFTYSEMKREIIHSQERHFSPRYRFSEIVTAFSTPKTASEEAARLHAALKYVDL